MATQLTGETLHQQLSATCRSAIEVVKERLERHGIPLTASVSVPVIERRGPGEWGSAERPETRNLFRHRGLGPQLAPWLSDDAKTGLEALGQRLAVASQTTLPFWSPFGGHSWLVDDPSAGGDQPRYEEQPGIWVTRFVVLPALQHHIENLTSFDEADACSTLFADEVLGVCADDRLRYRVRVPVSGIELNVSAGESLSSGPFTIRQLSDAEQGQFFLDSRNAWPLMGGPSEPPTALLENSVDGPRNAQHMTTGGDSRAFLAALELHGYSVGGGTALEVCDPKWLHPFSNGVAVVLPSRSSDSRVVSEAGLAEIAATASALMRYNLTEPGSPRDLSLHRFIAGVARSEVTDAVLDFTIALEALLLPDGSRGDLGYRFRMHGAHYLSDHAVHSSIVAVQLRDLYAVRSRLVHGGKYPDRTALSVLRQSAQELARRGLLRAVHQGFPTGALFEQMLLGSTRHDQPK